MCVVAAGGDADAIVIGRVVLGVDALEHEHRLAGLREGAQEGVDAAERVLAREDARVVEGEQERERRRSGRASGCERGAPGTGTGIGTSDDRHRRDRRQRVGDEAAAGPQLVDASKDPSQRSGNSETSHHHHPIE